MLSKQAPSLSAQPRASRDPLYPPAFECPLGRLPKSASKPCSLCFVSSLLRSICFHCSFLFVHLVTQAVLLFCSLASSSVLEASLSASGLLLPEVLGRFHLLLCSIGLQRLQFRPGPLDTTQTQTSGSRPNCADHCYLDHQTGHQLLYKTRKQSALHFNHASRQGTKARSFCA